MRGKSVVASALVVVLIASACSGAASPAPSAVPNATQAASAGQTASAEQTASPAASVGQTASPAASVGSGTTGGPHPYAGQSLRMWEFKTELGSDEHQKLLPEFEQATGTKVTLEAIPEGGYADKVKLAQLAKDSSYDVYQYDFAFRGQVVDRDAAEPLDPYLSDLARTPAAYDAGDIPDGLWNLCKYNGQTLCVPYFSNGTFFYYNKKIFADAGIAGPPKTIDEMVADAQKTNDPAKGIAGICMRGTPESANMFTGFMLSQYFLPYDDADQAVILDPTWKPMLTTPEALAWGNMYQTLMQKYAPKGISSYGYAECNRDFEQGKVAQYFESDAWPGEFLDKAKSQVTDDVGFSVIPCAAVNPNHCVVVAGHGWYINKYSQHKDAAWELIKWLSSPDIVSRVGVATKSYFQTTRGKAVDAVTQAGNFPADLGEAYKYQKANGHPNPFPPIPEILEVVLPVSRALSKIVSGEASVADALATANEEITDSLTKAGYIK